MEGQPVVCPWAHEVLIVLVALWLELIKWNLGRGTYLIWVLYLREEFFKLLSKLFRTSLLISCDLLLINIILIHKGSNCIGEGVIVLLKKIVQIYEFLSRWVFQIVWQVLETLTTPHKASLITYLHLLHLRSYQILTFRNLGHRKISRSLNFECFFVFLLCCQLIEIWLGFELLESFIGEFLLAKFIEDPSCLSINYVSFLQGHRKSFHEAFCIILLTLLRWCFFALLRRSINYVYIV